MQIQGGGGEQRLGQSRGLFLTKSFFLDPWHRLYLGLTDQRLGSGQVILLVDEADGQVGTGVAAPLPCIVLPDTPLHILR